MSATAPDSVLDDAWRSQKTWSLVADSLKTGVTRSRSAVLILTIAGALFTTGAAVAGLKGTAGKTLAACGAVAVGLAGIARTRTSTQAVEDWTRARSASEAIKTEVYTYLTGVGRYAGGGGEKLLEQQLGDIELDVADLQSRADDVVVDDDRKPPAIKGMKDYVDGRVQDQIDSYYRKKAVDYKGDLKLVRNAEVGLAVLGVVLAALAAALEVDDLAVWVPVVTTVATAITAHAAAERYEFLRVEFLRTATELEHLLKRWRRGNLADAALISSCENVISSQNERWMAKLSEKETTNPAQ
jgi:hypothetical protein